MSNCYPQIKIAESKMRPQNYAGRVTQTEAIYIENPRYNKNVLLSENFPEYMQIICVG